jgi:hypothetical protein
MAPVLEHRATQNMCGVVRMHYLTMMNRRECIQFKKEHFMEERNTKIGGPSYSVAVQKRAKAIATCTGQE